MRSLLIPVIAAPLASVTATVAANAPPLEETITGIAELVVQIIIGIIALIGLVRSIPKGKDQEK